MAVPATLAVEHWTGDLDEKLGIAGGAVHGRAPAVVAYPFVITYLIVERPSESWLDDDGETTLTVQTTVVARTRAQARLAQDRVAETILHDRPDGFADGDGTVSFIGSTVSDGNQSVVEDELGGLHQIVARWDLLVVSSDTTFVPEAQRWA